MNDRRKQNKDTKMKKIMRMTESDLLGIVNESAKRIVKEHINTENEIRLAYKELQQMGKHLSSLGLRLDGTRYRPLFDQLRDAMVQLNNELIKAMKGGGK